MLGGSGVPPGVLSSGPDWEPAEAGARGWNGALGCGELGEATLPGACTQVPPESFCELWIRDTKYVQQPCVALTVYVAMCHKFHVCIEWRRSDYCRELVGGARVRQSPLPCKSGKSL